MKKNSLLAFFALSFAIGFTAKAQVGINTTMPHASAALDIVSEDKGMLVPRLSLVQRGNISAPANGLLIYQTDNTPGFYFYSASQWQRLAGTGDAAGNYVDLSTDQTIVGKKTFNSDIKVNGHTVGRGGGQTATNLSIGANALATNTTGYTNTAVGHLALYSNTTGYANTATGSNSLVSNTTGNNNSAVGNNALLLNSTGSYNTATGSDALYNNTSGIYNTATGSRSLYQNSTGIFNTANGFQSLFRNTTGSYNTGLGFNALSANTIGNQNTASGFSALTYNTSGDNNTASGFSALFANTTGFNNTAIGVQALYSNTTGQNNTALGNYADVTVGTITNATAIGANAKVDASNKVQIGDASVTAVKLGGTAAVLETSQIKITGGSPGLNKVLTSDAGGLATWQTPATGTTISRKRSVILDVASLDATAALSAVPGTKKMIGGWQRPVLSLPEGSITQFQTQIPIPADWNGSSSFTMTVLYSSPTTSANFSVAFSYAATGIDDSTVVPIPLISTVAPESLTTANGLMEVSYNIPAKATDKLLFIWFRRGQNPSADTSTSEMHIHGVRIDYFD